MQGVSARASASVYANRFGSLTRAYELVGFRPERPQAPLKINRRLRQLHPKIVQHSEQMFAGLGGSVRRDEKTVPHTLNDEIVISLVLARCQTLANGQHHWRIRFNTEHFSPDLKVAVRLDPHNANELYYYLLPRLGLPDQEIQVSNSANFECFRFYDLNFFYGKSERERLQRKF